MSIFPEPIVVISTASSSVSAYALVSGIRDVRAKRLVWGIAGLFLGLLGIGTVLAHLPFDRSKAMTDYRGDTDMPSLSERPDK